MNLNELLHESKEKGKWSKEAEELLFLITNPIENKRLVR